MKRLLLKALNKLNLLGSVYLKHRINLNGRSFIIPIIHKMGYNLLSMSELWMIDLLKQLDLKEGTFVDVGVNMGQTLLKMRSVYHDMNYVGFEPNPTCVYYVNELIRTNKIDNVSILPVGLADKDGIFRLNFYHDNDIDSTASIIENFRPNSPIKRWRYVAVNKVETVQRVVDLSKTTFIKIDVEGAELEVVGSLRSVFSTQRPFGLIEILPVYDAATNQDRLNRQEAIERIFDELKYSWFRISKQGDIVSFEEISSIGIHSDLALCDYLLVPEERKKEIA